MVSDRDSGSSTTKSVAQLKHVYEMVKLPVTIDGITYDVVDASDAEALGKLTAEDYCLYEPCSQALGYPPESTYPLMLRLAQRAIADRASLKVP